MSEILVLGAGMVGVSTALALQARGHAVTLADRRAPGEETSYGNAGIIQVEAAEPYAMPRDIGTLWQFATGLSNDVVFSLSGVRKMAPALWRYFQASAPARHRAIAATYSQLTARASADHQPLILAAGADNLITRDGLAFVLRDARALEEAAADAERVRAAYGVRSVVHDGESWRKEEPALRMTPAGAVHYLDSWSASDPGGLTSAYARLFEARGGRILLADAGSLRRQGEGWAVDGPEGVIAAERVVLCLGPWTGSFLGRFGLKVPMILKRGYHGHYDSPRRPRRPFLDVANGVVVGAMAKGVRVTTGAALVTQDAPADPRQLRRAEQGLAPLFELGPRVMEPQWFGTRPCLPGMLPMVGAVPGQTGLWTNFGHGHQGFTLGPTTGLMLAEAMAGEGSALHAALSPAAQL